MIGSRRDGVAGPNEPTNDEAMPEASPDPDQPSSWPESRFGTDGAPAEASPADGPATEAPPTAPVKRGIDRSVIVRIALFAGIALFFVLFRDRLTGSAGDLQVGNCFDVPAALEEVEEVQRHPCTEPHDAEVMFVGEYADEKLYPSDAEWRSFVEARCIPAFESYVGRDYEGDPDLDIGWFIPSREGWDSDDREVSCWIFRVDEAKMSTSVKAGG